jgi:superoxide reductase
MIMPKLSETIQTADWKSEKHVPVIECPDAVKKEEVFQVKITIGREVPHPNTTEHHIRWIGLYYREQGGKFIREVSRVEFNAHGESVDGPDKGPVYTHHESTVNLKISKPGLLFALSYCNIHGLWQSEKEISLK